MNEEQSGRRLPEATRGHPNGSHVIVIGAGFAGLTAALELAQAGWAVTVIDALDRVGGLAAGFRDERWEWPLEHYYHHLFTSDSEAIQLARQVGGQNELLVRRPITAYQFRGRPYALDGVLPVLRFPGIPFPDRVRMGLVIAYLKLLRDWRPLERVTIRDWVCRWMGEPAYHVIWEPLLIGKFGDYHERVPMSWLWARLHKRSMRLIYYVGGFQAFANRLQAAVLAAGGRVQLNQPVQAIRRADGGLEVVTPSGTLSAEQVVFTGGPHLLVRLAPALPTDYRQRLEQLAYLGAIVVVLALERKLMEQVYWLSLDKRDYPFLACVEHTNFMSCEPYGGDHLVYLGDYPHPDHRYFGLSDEELLQEWLPALKSFNAHFEPSWIRRYWVSRTRYAQPVFELNHSQRLPPLTTPIPGLYLASMSQVYPWDRGTNYAIAIGREVARLILTQASRDASAVLGRKEAV